MEQLFATFYPRTKKLEPVIPRSQRYIISAQKKLQNSNGSKRHQSFSATRQNTWTTTNYGGNGQNYDKENNQPQRDRNFEDYIMQKYDEQKKNKKIIHPYALKKLQMRDLNDAVNSYKNFDIQHSKDLQNDLLEQQNSSFFGKKPKKSPTSQNKLNNIFDANERQNTTPDSHSKSKSNNKQQEGTSNPRYTELDEEQNYSSRISNKIGRKVDQQKYNTSFYNNSFKNNQLTQQSHQTNDQKTPNKENTNFYKDDSELSKDEEDESFEEFYVTLPHHQGINSTKPNYKFTNQNLETENISNQQGQSPQKKQYDDYDSFYEKLQNKEVQRSKKYPFFITKINILDQPNIYDVLSDKKTRHQTEPNGQSGHQPTYMKGFIKHDIHYIQSKNLRAALSAASKKRQNTSHSSNRNYISNGQITSSAQNTLPQEMITQATGRIQFDNGNRKIDSTIKKLDSNFRKNTSTFNRDNIGYNDTNQGFNQMYDGTQNSIAHNGFFRKTRDFRITKSSQGQRNAGGEEQQTMNLLERLNSYNHEGILKPNIFPNQINTKSPLKRVVTSQPKKRNSDSFSRMDGSPHSQLMHSPSKQKSPFYQNEQVIEFNQGLTLQKFLKKVKTTGTKIQ